MKAEEILPDNRDQMIRNGVIVRKGTVGAILVNARTWSEAAAGSPQRVAVEADIAEALPALRTSGLFEVLSVSDPALAAWIALH